MSIIVTEEDLINKLLKTVIIAAHGHENTKFHRKCELVRGIPSILDRKAFTDFGSYHEHMPKSSLQ